MEKHGMYKTRIYGIWGKMKDRCHNEKCALYKFYGAKGIKVCDRWNDFMNFLEDMGNEYLDPLSIDRINSKGNYEPSNCRWITRGENTSLAHREYSTCDDGTKVCKRGHVGMFYHDKRQEYCRGCRRFESARSRLRRKTKRDLSLLKSELTFN